jgi:hypothetical protein
VARKHTDKLIQKVVVRLDGKDWRLVITHNTLIECEDLTGLNLLTGEVNIIRPSAKLVRALLYLSLKHAGAEYSLEKVGELITPQNIVAVQEGLLSAWAASMPDPKEEDENPTPAAP